MFNNQATDFCTVLQNVGQLNVGQVLNQATGIVTCLTQVIATSGSAVNLTGVILNGAITDVLQILQNIVAAG